MKFRTGLVTMILVLSVVGPGVTAAGTTEHCSFPVTKTDATGTDVTLQKEPARVVTLSPSAAQTMWEIGAREKVVGVTTHASYLEGADSRTQVSGEEQLVSVETVVNMTPDLVLAPNVVSNETVAKLRDSGVTVYHFPPALTIDDVYDKTDRIGRLTGACQGADETISSMKARIGVVHEAVEGQDRPDALYLFFGFTAGDGTFIHEIIETAGGNNVAADANVSGYRQLNSEVIIRENPDWIIRNSENPLGVDSEVLNQTTAVRQNQTVTVQIEHINQPAPRVVNAITTLAKRFHPEAYAAANATSTPTQSPATDTRLPGFGTSVAVLAIGLAALLMRRE